MKLEYLPDEGDDEYIMYAHYDSITKKVIWSGCTDKSNYMDHMLDGTHWAQFQVCKRDKTVIVEAVGWYTSEFQYKVELTEQPDQVVMLAAYLADAMESA